MLSIITPVLDGAEFIEENIKSIISLDIEFEHIVVDGGSTDETLNIISKYPHIRVVHQKEKTGMYGAIHMGFEKAKGEFFAYVNCDDLVLKEGFEAMYEKISNHVEIDFVYSNAVYNYIEDSKHVDMIAKEDAAFFLKRGIMPFVQPSCIYSRSKYNAVGGLRFKKFKLCGDLDLFQRLVLSGVKPIKVNVFSSIFLKYSGSLAAVSKEKMKRERLNLTRPPAANSFINKVFFKLKR